MCALGAAAAVFVCRDRVSRATDRSWCGHEVHSGGNRSLSKPFFSVFNEGGEYALLFHPPHERAEACTLLNLGRLYRYMNGFQGKVTVYALRLEIRFKKIVALRS